MIKHGAGEMAQLLRTLAILIEEPDVVSTSSSGTSQPPTTLALGI